MHERGGFALSAQARRLCKIGQTVKPVHNIGSSPTSSTTDGNLPTLARHRLAPHAVRNFLEFAGPIRTYDGYQTISEPFNTLFGPLPDPKPDPSRTPRSPRTPVPPDPSAPDYGCFVKELRIVRLVEFQGSPSRRGERLPALKSTTLICNPHHQGQAHPSRRPHAVEGPHRACWRDWGAAANN